MKISKTKEAINRLAALFEWGALLATTIPSEFLNQVADEIERLRREHSEAWTALELSELNYRASLAEIKRLREALAPFAKAAEKIPDFGPHAKAFEDILALRWKDGGLPMFGTEFHRARAALEGKDS